MTRASTATERTRRAEYILSDGKTAGLTRKVKNADLVDLTSTPAVLPDDEEIDDAVDEPAADDLEVERGRRS